MSCLRSKSAPGSGSIGGILRPRSLVCQGESLLLVGGGLRRGRAVIRRAARGARCKFRVLAGERGGRFSGAGLGTPVVIGAASACLLDEPAAGFLEVPMAGLEVCLRGRQAWLLKPLPLLAERRCQPAWRRDALCQLYLRRNLFWSSRCHAADRMRAETGREPSEPQ